MLSFPFSVAVDLVWFTPAVSFAQALLFLSIDKAGGVMDTPFTSNQWFGLDLEKRVRRSDKETAALVGAWSGAPCHHFDLFPDTARSTLPKQYHEDNIHGGSLNWFSYAKQVSELPKTKIVRPHARQATNSSFLRREGARCSTTQSAARSVGAITAMINEPLLASVSSSGGTDRLSSSTRVTSD